MKTRLTLPLNIFYLSSTSTTLLNLGSVTDLFIIKGTIT